MSIINTTVGAITDGTYGMPNSIIGQLKTILLNDSNVTVISDNDPDNTTARVLVYSVASQSHYTKIASTSGAAITIYTLKLDGETALSSPIAVTVSSGVSYAVRFLYNTKVHAFMFANIYALSIYLNTGDPTGWYLKAIATGSNTTVYYNDSDVAGTLYNINYGKLDDSGRFVGIPCRFLQGSNIKNYYNPYFYGTATEISSSAGFFTSGGYNFLVVNGSFVISDQIPS